MTEPTRAPSRVSIVVMAVMSSAVFAGAIWIVTAPVEQYTVRHTIGFIFGCLLGLELALDAAIRFCDRVQAGRDA